MHQRSFGNEHGGVIGDLRGLERLYMQAGRSKDRKAINAAISEITATKPSNHWIELFEANGIPCGPINTIDQALEHPQVAARNMLVTVDDPITGPMKISGNPLKISGFEDPATRAPAPDLDADRQRILDELGL